MSNILTKENKYTAKIKSIWSKNKIKKGLNLSNNEEKKMKQWVRKKKMLKCRENIMFKYDVWIQEKK